ncbi:transposable element Tcb2 transposase [Trichonephila clavipes]|nr:transposable element Tcb2 transposase [Trichonephila clavipes]
MDNCIICHDPGTGSTFTRDPVSSRTIRWRLADGCLGSRRPLRELPLTHTLRHLHLMWCCARGHWTASEWKQVVSSDESRFNLSSDDRGERFNPVFAL